MKDVSLDDLIKQDKQQKKLQRKQKKFEARVKGDRKGGPKRFIKREFGSNKQDFNERGKQSKNKPINKERTDGKTKKFQNRLNRNRDREDRPRQNQNKREQQKKQKQPKQNQQQAQKQQKGRTLRILGLHPDITNEDLYKLFAAEGALEKCMIEQDNFGRNLPSAIVKYYNPQTAKKAIENINNKKVMNSVLTVEPYRHKK